MCYIYTTSVLVLSVLDMMWSRHPDVMINSGYDVNRAPASSLPIVELWSGKTFFLYWLSAQLRLHCMYMQFQILLTLFKLNKSLSPKVFFQSRSEYVWSEWCGIVWLLKHLKHTSLSLRSDEHWIQDNLLTFSRGALCENKMSKSQSFSFYYIIRYYLPLRFSVL